MTRFDSKDWNMFTKDWHMFTVEDGLAKGGVSAIMEDKDGILWFGSNLGGITCFDGTDFTAFTIGEYEDLKDAAFDPYVAIRDAYYQYRRNKISE